MSAISAYEQVRNELANEIQIARSLHVPVGLKKATSNLFRTRDQTGKRRIDVRRLSHVLHIDPAQRRADVEGMATYETIVRATLPHGLLPAVTPELKTITAGGAVSGLGIESSSFRYGLVHETVVDAEVLVVNGTVTRCSRDVGSDLFYSLPNSYGTLGYIVRLTLGLIPAKRYVRLTHSRCSQVDDCFRAMTAAVEDPDTDFLEGTVFRRGEMYLSSASFCDEAPATSNYRYLRIYLPQMCSVQMSPAASCRHG